MFCSSCLKTGRTTQCGNVPQTQPTPSLRGLDGKVTEIAKQTQRRKSLSHASRKITEVWSVPDDKLQHPGVLLTKSPCQPVRVNNRVAGAPVCMGMPPAQRTTPKTLPWSTLAVVRQQRTLKDILPRPSGATGTPPAESQVLKAPTKPQCPSAHHHTLQHAPDFSCGWQTFMSGINVLARQSITQDNVFCV